MEKEKKFFYARLMALISNIGVLFALALSDIYNLLQWHSVGFDDIQGLVLWNLATLLIFFSMSFIPVVVAESSYEGKKSFAIGVPLLLIFFVICCAYNYYTCTGKFCQLGPVILGWGSGLAAIIFIFFYLAGIYFRKWNIKFIVFLLLINFTLTAIAILYLAKYLFN